MHVKNNIQTSPFQQALLQAISANAIDLIAVINVSNQQIVYINESGARLFGYKNPVELINKKPPSLRRHKLNKGLVNLMLKNISRKGVYTDEIEYITVDKKYFWGRLQVNPFKAEEIKYALVQIEKIDRAKSAEDKLIKEKKRFGALLDYASIAVVIVNRQQEIILMNPCALKLFGYKNTEVTGKKIEILIHPDYRRQHRKYHNNYFNYPENRPMGAGRELTAIKKDGTIFPVQISLGSYKSENEVYVMAYLTDITLRRQREEEIARLNADLENKIKLRTEELDITIKKLERQVKETIQTEEELKKSLEREKELSSLKTRFVSIASHEFRTPLSTILSSVYLLQKYINTEDQPKRDKHIERIAGSVNMLTDILNDFLNVGKIEEGRMFPKFSYINVCELATEVMDELKSMFKKGQNISCYCKVSRPVWLDASMLKHIMSNLLSNASKFSRENAGIKIVINQKGALLTISVSDNGIGISNEDQQHLFERFYRGANAANISGTGLGLHIVKKYAELMNGKVACKSELDSGSTFTVSFKLKQGENILY